MTRPKNKRFICAKVDVDTANHFVTIPHGKKEEWVATAIEEKMEREPPVRSKTIAVDWPRTVASHISADLHDVLRYALSRGKLAVYLREAITEKVQRETGKGKRKK